MPYTFTANQTTTFTVRDADAFLADAARHGIDGLFTPTNHDPATFEVDPTDEGYLPGMDPDDIADRLEDNGLHYDENADYADSIPALISRHLTPGTTFTLRAAAVTGTTLARGTAYTIDHTGRGIGYTTDQIDVVAAHLAATADQDPLEVPEHVRAWINAQPTPTHALTALAGLHDGVYLPPTQDKDTQDEDTQDEEGPAATQA